MLKTDLEFGVMARTAAAVTFASEETLQRRALEGLANHTQPHVDNRDDDLVSRHAARFRPSVV